MDRVNLPFNVSCLKYLRETLKTHNKHLELTSTSPFVDRVVFRGDRVRLFDPNTILFNGNRVRMFDPNTITAFYVHIEGQAADISEYARNEIASMPDCYNNLAKVFVDYSETVRLLYNPDP